MNINRVFQFIALVAIIITYTVFFLYYLQQRQQTAAVIIDTIQDDVAELAYNISRNLTNNEPLESSRAVIDRAVANNNYIRAVSLFDEGVALVSTDPEFNVKPASVHALSNVLDENLLLLERELHAGNRVRYFDGFNARQLDLVTFIDHQEIARFLNINQSVYLWYFVAFPAILMLILYLVVLRFLVRPLVALRQFAYYHDKVPDGFRINELESIRYTLRDTFRRLEQEQRELYQSARLDSLSGLANRNALQEYVASLISEYGRAGKEFAFLFMDFDNFKAINDSMGHEVGDEVIQEASRIIATEIRSHDFAARVGGDEFVMIIKTYNSKEELGRIVQRIQNALNQHGFAGEHKLQVGSSVGIAIYPHDGEDFLELMKNSDIAMFEAKGNKNSSYHYFSSDLNRRVQQNIKLDQSMRAALRGG